MKKLLLVSLCFLMFCITQVFAQNRTVTGTVTAKDDGLPIPGVTVKVKGTSNGVQTNTAGKYTITDVPNGAVLVFSSIGYEPLSLTPTGLVLNAELTTSSKQLGEVVVTGALGIARTRNQQSYAAQEISGDEVSKQRQTNFIDGLSGKVAGLQITQSNSAGSSTNVILRGTKSIYGDNQAIFVIDGVVINNEVTNSGDQQAGGGGYDYGSPASDVNPDDIESITVLKGAGATALYGSRGSNGVILITTKHPKNGLGITLNSTTSIRSMDKSTFPKYQNQYGAGYGAFYDDPTGYFFYFDVNGDGNPDLVTPTTEDASFGAKFDPNLQVYQWDAFIKGLPNYGKSTPWVAAKNGPASFFISPLSTNESLLITNGGTNGSFKLGYTNSVDRDIIPNSAITKNQFDFAATYNITPKLIAGASINYYRVDGQGRTGTGYDGTNSDARNVLTNFREWWELNNDVQELKQAYQLNGGQNATWNMADPANGNYGAIYWNNPYWVTNHDFETDSRNRYIGNVSLNYKPFPWLNITGKASLDTYSTLQEEHYDVTSIGLPYYSRYNKNFSETNYDLLATVDRNLSEDFNFKALLGTNIRKDYTNSIFAQTNGGLIVPGVYALSNSLTAPLAPGEAELHSEVNGIFGGATFTWKKLLTLDGTIRRDISSTLPQGANAYVYPSVSGGFNFSELLKTTWLSFGKIRASYAQVGSDAPIFSIYDTYNINSPYGSAPQTSLNNTKNNSSLKPERTTSKEVGVEMAFFNNRLGFDATYYNGLTFDEILPVKVSSATGFLQEYLNAGSVRNQGVELSINGTPIKVKDFAWNIRVNFSHNQNKVESLYKDGSGNEAKNLELGSFQNGESLDAPLGGALGTIEGSDYTYLNGQKVVKSNGQYQKTVTNNIIIGNSNPQWIGGLNNEFKYKSFSLSFLIDVHHGGNVFSQDMAYGLATGLYPETAYINDLGNPVRNTLANGGGFIRPGVTADGSPNTMRVSATNYTAFGYVYLPDKAFIYDASFVKLRETLIGYSLPKEVVSKIGLSNLTLQLIGHNLWIIHKNLPYSDPEDNLSAGNTQGIQEGAFPSVRTFSFNLKASF